MNEKRFPPGAGFLLATVVGLILWAVFISAVFADESLIYDLPATDTDCHILDDGQHKGWRMVEYTERLKVQVQVRNGLLEWRRDPSLICKNFTTKKEEVRWVEWVRPARRN